MMPRQTDTGQEEVGGKAVRVAYPWEGVKVSSSMYAHIRRNPRFTELVAKRTRFAGILAAIVLIVFYGFVLLVAFRLPPWVVVIVGAAGGVLLAFS